VKRLFLTLALVALAGSSLASTSTKPMTHPAAKMPDHGLSTPDAIKWGPPPAVFASGAQFAVLQGDPSASGLYVVRLKMPDGYKIMPHWHPTTENVTVISGTFHLGTGDKFDDTMGSEMPAGSFGFIGPNMHHYAWATGETIVQVHGMGPFKLTYVNPADDPSKMTAK
jgi:anti-sigma factor ChrR (cupin superfamily)